MTCETDLAHVEEWWINVYDVNKSGHTLKELTYFTSRWDACKDIVDMTERWGWTYLGTIENVDCSTGATRIVYLPDHSDFPYAEQEYEEERYEYDRELARGR